MSFKLGTVVIGQHFVGRATYLNGLEGVVTGEPVKHHIHTDQSCLGDVMCQQVKWCDGKEMPFIPVMNLREKRPPADDRDTEWANDLLKKITQPVKEPELV